MLCSPRLKATPPRADPVHLLVQGPDAGVFQRGEIHDRSGCEQQFVQHRDRYRTQIDEALGVAAKPQGAPGRASSRRASALAMPSSPADRGFRCVVDVGRPVDWAIPSRASPYGRAAEHVRDELPPLTVDGGSSRELHRWVPGSRPHHAALRSLIADVQAISGRDRRCRSGTTVSGRSIGWDIAPPLLTPENVGTGRYGASS